MFAPPPGKRARSPSPPIDIDHSSPLDILLKRRRRSPHASYIDHSYKSSIEDRNPFDDSGSRHPNQAIPYSRFIEKRRTRQWERLNAPQTSRPFSLTSNTDQHDDVTFHSQPDPLPHYTSSPIPIPRSYSQPGQTNNHIMSSSPIRHQPPSSSPFRDDSTKHNYREKLEMNSSGTRIGDDGGREDLMEDIGEDEMKREWGEEYVTQNSLLHSLVSHPNGPLCQLTIL
jgi:hypothetical protein